MLRVFLDPYILVTTVAIASAVVSALHTRFAEPDVAVGKRFAKTLAIYLAVGLVLVFVANRPEDILNEPFAAGEIADF